MIPLGEYVKKFINKTIYPIDIEFDAVGRGEAISAAYSSIQKTRLITSALIGN